MKEWKEKDREGKKRKELEDMERNGKNLVCFSYTSYNLFSGFLCATAKSSAVLHQSIRSFEQYHQQIEEYLDILHLSIS